MNRKKAFLIICVVLLTELILCGTTFAAEEAASGIDVTASLDELQTNVNVVWTCIAAFLVFFMQAGFAMVEAGFTRAKNAVNILMKNLMDFSVGTIAFFLIGFGLMFGKTNGIFGTTLFGLSGVEPGTDWNWTFLIFQTVFAATAATIVSGAMAERTKFIGYLVYSFFISLLIYPIFGSWAWGGLLDGVAYVAAVFRRTIDDRHTHDHSCQNQRKAHGLRETHAQKHKTDGYGHRIVEAPHMAQDHIKQEPRGHSQDHRPSDLKKR